MEHLSLLGKRAKDKVTGFTGIITAKCYHLYGCAQYAINPAISEDGKLNTVNWFDEGRIDIIGEGILPSSVQSDVNGCETQDHP